MVFRSNQYDARENIYYAYSSSSTKNIQHFGKHQKKKLAIFSLELYIGNMHFLGDKSVFFVSGDSKKADRQLQEIPAS